MLSGILIIFLIDSLQKNIMKSYPPERSGITLLNAPEGSPEVHVSLIRSEGFKFLAGINHNTPFVFIHDINIMYGMLISCKELHWFYIYSLIYLFNCLFWNCPQQGNVCTVTCNVHLNVKQKEKRESQFSHLVSTGVSCTCAASRQL